MHGTDNEWNHAMPASLDSNQLLDTAEDATNMNSHVISSCVTCINSYTTFKQVL